MSTIEAGGTGDNSPSVSRNDFLLAETYRDLECSAAEIRDSKTTISSLQTYNIMVRHDIAEKEPDADPRLTISYFDLALGYTTTGPCEEAVRCKFMLHSTEGGSAT